MRLLHFLLLFCVTATGFCADKHHESGIKTGLTAEEEHAQSRDHSQCESSQDPCYVKEWDTDSQKDPGGGANKYKQDGRHQDSTPSDKDAAGRRKKVLSKDEVKEAELLKEEAEQYSQYLEMTTNLLRRSMEGLGEMIDQMEQSGAKAFHSLDGVMDQVAASKDRVMRRLDRMMSKMSHSLTDSRERMKHGFDSVMETVSSAMSQSRERMMDSLDSVMETMSTSRTKVMEEIDYIIDVVSHSEVIEDIKALPKELGESFVLSVRNRSYVAAGVMMAVTTLILVVGAVYFAWCHHDGWSYHTDPPEHLEALQALLSASSGQNNGSKASDSNNSNRKKEYESGISSSRLLAASCWTSGSSSNPVSLGAGELRKRSSPNAQKAANEDRGEERNGTKPASVVAAGQVCQDLKEEKCFDNKALPEDVSEGRPALYEVEKDEHAILPSSNDDAASNATEAMDSGVEKINLGVDLEEISSEKRELSEEVQQKDRELKKIPVPETEEQTVVGSSNVPTDEQPAFVKDSQEEIENPASKVSAEAADGVDRSIKTAASSCGDDEDDSPHPENTESVDEALNVISKTETNNINTES